MQRRRDGSSQVRHQIEYFFFGERETGNFLRVFLRAFLRAFFGLPAEKQNSSAGIRHSGKDTFGVFDNLPPPDRPRLPRAPGGKAAEAGVVLVFGSVVFVIQDNLLCERSLASHIDEPGQPDQFGQSAA